MKNHSHNTPQRTFSSYITFCKLRKIAVVAWAVCMPFFCSVAMAANQQIHLVSSDFPPYFGPQLNHGGPVTQIVVQAFQRSHYTVHIQYLPWARAIAELRDGNTDGMLSIGELPAKDGQLVYSSAIFNLQLGFFKQSDRKISFKQLSDLQAYKVGVVRGYPNPNNFLAAQLSSFESLDDTSNLRKLAIGRLDLVLADKQAGQFLINTRLSDMRVAIGWQGQAIANPSQHLVLTRKRADFGKVLAAFQNGLRQMELDGSLQEIWRNAGLE